MCCMCQCLRAPCASVLILIQLHRSFPPYSQIIGCLKVHCRLSESGVFLQAVDNWSNFETYKLRRPVGLIRADAHRSPFRESLAEVSLLYSAKLRCCTRCLPCSLAFFIAWKTHVSPLLTEGFL